MGETVGVMIAGLGGCISGCVIAGVEAMRMGTTRPLGILTETERMPVDGRFAAAQNDTVPLIRDALDLARFEDIRFAGWDIRPQTLYEATMRDSVVHSSVLEPMEEFLSSIVPLSGVVREGGVAKTGRVELRFDTLRQAADSLQQDIQDFRDREGLDRVVVVNLTPTTPLNPDSPLYTDLGRFEAALDAATPDPAITPGMLYFYAACKTGSAHVNFTPNFVEIPALCDLALDSKVPFCGRDGKTGQTFLKTVLAPGFRARQLRVLGWYSTNFLGNNDGKALANPEAVKSKLMTKGSVLDSILGYPVVSENGESTHIVRIDYYPPRGDAKEAWDNIDVEGFLGARMQVKVNFLCRDSILAAPLIIDLVRFAGNALRRGEAGPMNYLSQNFKLPLPDAQGTIIHDFFQQQQMLARYLEQYAE